MRRLNSCAHILPPSPLTAPRSHPRTESRNRRERMAFLRPRSCCLGSSHQSHPEHPVSSSIRGPDRTGRHRRPEGRHQRFPVQLQHPKSEQRPPRRGAALPGSAPQGVRPADTAEPGRPWLARRSSLCQGESRRPLCPCRPGSEFEYRYARRASQVNRCLPLNVPPPVLGAQALDLVASNLAIGAHGPRELQLAVAKHGSPLGEGCAGKVGQRRPPEPGPCGPSSCRLSWYYDALKPFRPSSRPTW